MLVGFLAAAALLYLIATVLMLTYLVGVASTLPSRRAATVSLGAAMVAHVTHDILRWVTLGRGPFAGIHEGLSTLALLVAGVAFALRLLGRRLETLGVFVAPLTLLMLLASQGVDAQPAAPLSGALLGVHVGSTILGTAAFTVAFALAAAYLVQEREVRQKRLRGMFQRLPPLEVLDVASFRSIALGLPALTLGLVTGLSAGLQEVGRGIPIVSWRHYLALGVWAVFAAVLALRLLAGWRGHRAAIGTIVGYASAVMVLVGYFVRGARL
ncbi:MAG: hypothetical protein EPO40_30585 [Myxococcaceae bacterium]|nr:MAG: hypothetical protein EPO40_30585 [Myxococcaceae bacterium]